MKQAMTDSIRYRKSTQFEANSCYCRANHANWIQPVNWGTLKKVWKQRSSDTNEHRFGSHKNDHKAKKIQK